MGTYVWDGRSPDCPSNLVQLYRGPMKFYVNSTATVSLSGSLAVLKKDDQVAGLELANSFPLCHHTAWHSHLKDVILVIHANSSVSIAKQEFDPSVVSETTRIEAEFSFLLIKSTLSQKELLRQIKVAVCENRWQTLRARHEAGAGSDNPYSLKEVFGRGVLLSKAGGAVYVTVCSQVEAEPRAHPLSNCTHESPS